MAAENLIGQLRQIVGKRENLVGKLFEAREENLGLSLESISSPNVWGELVVFRCLEMGGEKAVRDIALYLGRDESAAYGYALELKGGNSQYFLRLGGKREAVEISLLAPVVTNKLSTSVVRVGDRRVEETVKKSDILSDSVLYQLVIAGLAELHKEAPMAHTRLQELLRTKQEEKERLAKQLADLLGLISDRKYIRGVPRNPDPQG